MLHRLLLSTAAVALLAAQLYSTTSNEQSVDLNLNAGTGATELRSNTGLEAQEVLSIGQLPGVEEHESQQQSLQLSRYLWSETGQFMETGDAEVHTFIGDAWMAGSDLMLARNLWQDTDHNFKEEADRDVHHYIGEAWMLSLDALIAQLDARSFAKGQQLYGRYLWKESQNSFREEMDTDVHPFIGDVLVSETDAMLARYLWRESEGFRETQDTDVHTFIGDAWMAESDLMLARFLWRETESMDQDVNTDVRTFVGDAWMAESDLMLARYLWRESEGFSEARDTDVHTFIGDAWMAESDLMLARYLWEEEATAEAEVHLARYLWQDAEGDRFVEREDTDVHTFVGDAWMASPDLMLARHLWEETPSSEESAEGRVARHLWEEQPAEGSAERLLTRHLWEEQPSEQSTDMLLARHLWEEQPSEQSSEMRLARHLWEEQPAADNAEMLMARYLWQEGTSEVSIDAEVQAETQSYVVSGHDYEAMMVHLSVIGATTTSTLPLINTAEVELTDSQFERLSRSKIAGLMPNATVQTASVRDRATGQHLARETEFTKLIEADVLHREGVRGQGVGVAIVDTGMWNDPALSQNTDKSSRVVAYYDAIADSEEMPLSDESGHGSHISSVIASSLPSYADGQFTGSYHGVAPDADLIVVKAFNGDGSGTYMDVIRAISYVIEHKEEHNIRVLNLSFSGSPQSHYWEDPINVAVMEAWRAGIVVVASAGNSGPDPLTIGVPGNVPYIVTVGAMTDSYTPGDTADDIITSFSAAGPTFEGHVKPDIVAPGGHMMGMMSAQSSLANEYPQFHDGGRFFEMSGTSQSSAVAAGVAALMLQLHPELSPDDVKCRLMSSAKSAVQADGTISYSIFQQGAGLVNALDATLSLESGCANSNLDLDADLNGTTHFGGPAQQDAEGNFVVVNEGDGAVAQVWGDSHTWNASHAWRSSHTWNATHSWRSSHTWNATHVWSSTQVWNTGAIEAGENYATSYESNGYNWSSDILNNNSHVWNTSHVWGSGHLWRTAHTWGSSHIWNTASIWDSSMSATTSAVGVNRWVGQE